MITQALFSCLAVLGAAALTTTNPVETGRTAEFLIENAPDTGGANPYDPGAVALDVEFTPPSGPPLTMPAFWAQEYARAFADGRETLEKTGAPGWRVRHTAAVPGRHAWRLMVSLGGGGFAEAGRGEFEALPPRRPWHGYGRAKKGARYFSLDDGTPLPLLGSNLCWHGAAGTRDYDQWLGAFADAGMNYTRLWMSPYAFAVEVAPGERLNYNQEGAWRLDYVMRLAEEKGVRVMLCLDFHGIFQDKPDVWGGNNFWPDHPYNAAQGGPCATQNDFFTSPGAAELHRKRMRYLVARYTAFPSLLSWQFFNEINNVYGVLNRGDVTRWHGVAARALRAMDPCAHPITTSFSGWHEEADMWSMPEMDYCQLHLYHDPSQKPLGGIISAAAERFAKRFDKPVFVGEFGATWRNPGAELDPHRRAMRQAVWTGLLGGMAGTAMPWWWEDLHAAGCYGVWKSLADFVGTTGLGGPGWGPVKAEGGENADVYALSDGAWALAYVIDRRCHYPRGRDKDAPEARRAVVTLRGLADGPRTVEWWDTAAGRVVHTGEGKTVGGKMVLTSPPFSGDTALRVLPVAEK